MNIRRSIKTGIWLLIATLTTFILAEITRQALFTWLGMGLSVWFFLHAYWLSIVYLAYRGNAKQKNSEIVPIEETAELIGRTLVSSPESTMPMQASQSLQQTTLE